jgi:(p)ppGpp synthase/HD superfamily hydrolase
MSLFSPLVEQAAELAAEWHDGTYRKGRWRPPAFDLPAGLLPRIPMIAHVATVALTVLRAGFDDEVVAAAYLHDTVEDANASGAQMRASVLRERFGARVAELVLAVSEPVAPPGSPGLEWQQRKDGYLSALRAGPPEASAISLADKLHNLWTTNESLTSGVDVFTSTPSRRGLSAGPDRQRWFYHAVLQTTEQHQDERLDALRAELRAQLERFDRLTGLA